MTDQQRPSTSRGLRGARRVAIITIIASLSITAIIGIITLFSGDFGETQGKVLLSTLLVAALSITSLCHLAVAGRTWRIVGYVGLAVSAVAFVFGMILIWKDWSSTGDDEFLVKTFVVSGILALSFAHANLMLVLGDRKRQMIRVGLWLTVAFIALVAILIILPIVTDGDIPGENGDNYWRIFGVVAILDALGTIVLPVTGLFMRDEPAARQGAATVGHVHLALEIPTETDARLTALAAERGTTREAVAAEALTEFAKG